LNGFGVLEKNCGGDCVPYEIQVPADQGGGDNGGEGGATPADGGTPPDNSTPPADTTPVDSGFTNNILRQKAALLLAQDEPVINVQVAPADQGTTDQGTTDQGTTDQSATGEQGPTWSCGCVLQQCKGNSCQKLVNLLRGKTMEDSCPQYIPRCGMQCYYSKQADNCSQKCLYNGDNYGIKEAFEDLQKSFEDGQVAKDRSEIIKQLAYSRKQTDTCGSRSVAYGSALDIKMLNCQRVMDEIVFPESQNYFTTILDWQVHDNYCYGRWAGMVFENKNLTDDWYCCEAQQTNPQ
jgi:hypothetical protein